MRLPWVEECPCVVDYLFFCCDAELLPELIEYLEKGLLWVDSELVGFARLLIRIWYKFEEAVDDGSVDVFVFFEVFVIQLPLVADGRIDGGIFACVV